jgi:transposase
MVMGACFFAENRPERWHSCPDYGTSLHRDQNAAMNIERLGQSLWGEVA